MGRPDGLEENGRCLMWGWCGDGRVLPRRSPTVYGSGGKVRPNVWDGGRWEMVSLILLNARFNKECHMLLRKLKS